MKEVVFSAANRFQLISLTEIFRYRELLYVFVWRDIKIKYKQTVLGVVWVLFQPFISTGVFTLFFGRLVKIPSGELPYSLFVYSGLIYWFFFSNSLARISEIITGEQNLIKKIYFPKIILTVTPILVYLLEFAISAGLLFVISFVLGYYPNPWIVLLLPLSLLLTGMAALGIGLVLASLNVRYRDVRVVLPFFIQLLLFVTPVIYPLSIVGDQNKLLMAINPVTSSVEMIRLSFSHSIQFNPWIFLISFVSACTILFCGLWYFSRTERFFADIV